MVLGKESKRRFLACVREVKGMLCSLDATITETKYIGKKLIYSQLQGMQFRIPLERMHLSVCQYWILSDSDLWDVPNNKPDALHHVCAFVCLFVCVCHWMCVFYSSDAPHTTYIIFQSRKSETQSIEDFLQQYSHILTLRLSFWIITVFELTLWVTAKVLSYLH